MCFPVFEKKMKLLEKGKATLQGLADAQALAFLETVYIDLSGSTKFIVLVYLITALKGQAFMAEQRQRVKEEKLELNSKLDAHLQHMDARKRLEKLKALHALRSAASSNADASTSPGSAESATQEPSSSTPPSSVSPKGSELADRVLGPEQEAAPVPPTGRLAMLSLSQDSLEDTLRDPTPKAKPVKRRLFDEPGEWSQDRQPDFLPSPATGAGEKEPPVGPPEATGLPKGPSGVQSVPEHKDGESMDDATLFRNMLELQNVTDTPTPAKDDASRSAGDITPTEPEVSDDEGSDSEPDESQGATEVSAELRRRFLHGTKHERDTLIKMMMDLNGQKDQFATVAEKFIERETKKGEYTIVAGFYTVEAMRKRIKACVAHCKKHHKKSNVLIRKDIYEKDKKEYWAHVSTSGKFIRINEKTHTHEYAGEEAAKEARKAAKSSKGEPKVMVSDDESSDSDSEVASSSCTSVQPSKSKRKRESSSEKKPKKKSKKSPKHTPKSRKGKSKKLKKSGRKASAKKSPKKKEKKEKKAEQEPVLEEKLDKSKARDAAKKQTELHDKQREVEMVCHEYNMTVLKASKKRARDDEGEDEASDLMGGFIEAVRAASMAVHVDVARLLWLWRRLAPEVCNRLVCEIAHSFWAEYKEATGVDSDDDALASAAVLKAMSRASKTRHENQTEALYIQQGLSAPIPISRVDLPKLPGHPYFKVSDYLRVFTEQEKLHLLMGGEVCFDKIAEFWRRYQAVCPEHPIYKKSESCRRFQIPVLLYADEGQTLKKQAIMIVSFQPALGNGTLSNQHHRPNDDGMGLNFAGSSYATRFLLSCLLKNKYRKSAETFDELIRVFVHEFNLVFEEGIAVSLASGNHKLGLSVIGVKGDWPILTRMGYLHRHFGRLAFGADREGICHLCMAGTVGVPFHEYDEHAKWTWFKGGDTTTIMLWLECVYDVINSENSNEYMIAIGGALRCANEFL
ncbi:unnamed protein product, partial [Symbiodinium microadriaticum]